MVKEAINYSKLPDRPYPTRKYKEPIVVRYGKETSVYKEIQSQVDETDLYKTMEKYHTLEDKEQAIKERIEKNPKGVFADVTNIQINEEKRLDIFGQQKKIKDLWDSLPIDVRREADFNIEKLPEIANKYISKWELEYQAKQPKQEPVKEPEEK